VADAGREPLVSGSRDAFAAVLAIEMRAPLARVQLAASQLCREASTPSARQLAEGICDVVGDLDRRIATLLGVLVPPTPTPAVELAPLLGALRRRLAPVLAARGVVWDASPEGETQGSGDPDACLTISLALLRTGTELAGPGAALALSLQREDDWLGVRLERRHGENPACFAAKEAWKEVRSLVLSRGGAFELGETGVTAWLRRPEAACAAS
jgi:hypothetical protein